MALKSDAIFEEKMTFGLKNGMKNLVNFHTSIRKSEKLYLMGYFSRKYVILELRELCVMTLKSDAKIEGKITCGYKNGMKNLVKFHTSSQR